MLFSGQKNLPDNGDNLEFQETPAEEVPENPASSLSPSSSSSTGESLSEPELAVQKAQEIFYQLKGQGVDMSDGPCISENLMPDWVADVAHNPRQAVDNLAQNQCQNFRNGIAHHFVELDLDGNLIKVY